MKLRLLTGVLHVAVLMSFLSVLPLPAAGSRDVRKFVLDSPDGRLKAEINVGDKVFWTVGYDGETILDDSYISMTLSDGTVYGEGPGFLKSVSGSEDSDIEALFYKKDIVTDRYNFLTLKFKGFDLMFRAYDDGVAYRFVSKSRKPFKLCEGLYGRFREPVLQFIREYLRAHEAERMGCKATGFPADSHRSPGREEDMHHRI